MNFTQNLKTQSKPTSNKKPLPGFEIYNKYKSKAITRLNWVLEQLKEKPELFSDQNYTVNREEASWAENENALNHVLKKLINSDYVREVIQQLDKNVTDIKPESKKLAVYVSEAREYLNRIYSRWIKNIKEFESSDVQEIYLTTLTHMFDPHTVFMNMKEKRSSIKP